MNQLMREVLLQQLRNQAQTGHGFDMNLLLQVQMLELMQAVGNNQDDENETGGQNFKFVDLRSLTVVLEAVDAAE